MRNEGLFVRVGVLRETRGLTVKELQLSSRYSGNYEPCELPGCSILHFHPFDHASKSELKR